MSRPTAPPWEHPGPVLVVAAHPDDETIGAGVLLSRLARRGAARVLHVTDGAPRDPRYAERQLPGGPQEYAARRQRELETAMGLAGLGPERLGCLGYPDQEAVLELPRLARDLAEVFRGLFRETAGLVITHAYEGGHPDHDAAAFAAAASVRLLEREGRRPPELLEMPLYRSGSGSGIALCEFLPADTPQIRLRPEPGERALKERMLAAFASQERILSWFLPPRDEIFRPAPAHDFTRPPHPGPLQYELWSFPCTGGRWRELARQALAELDARGGR